MAPTQGVNTIFFVNGILVRIYILITMSKNDCNLTGYPRWCKLGLNYLIPFVKFKYGSIFNPCNKDYVDFVLVRTERNPAIQRVK